MKKTVDITPTWMGLARIVLDDLKRSNLPTRAMAITGWGGTPDHPFHYD